MYLWVDAFPQNTFDPFPQNSCFLKDYLPKKEPRNQYLVFRNEWWLQSGQHRAGAWRTNTCCSDKWDPSKTAIVFAVWKTKRDGEGLPIASLSVMGIINLCEVRQLLHKTKNVKYLKIRKKMTFKQPRKYKVPQDYLSEKIHTHARARSLSPIYFMISLNSIAAMLLMILNPSGKYSFHSQCSFWAWDNFRVSFLQYLTDPEKYLLIWYQVIHN